MREAARKMEEKHFSNHATHVEFLPVEWRSKLTLDGGIFCLKLNEFSQ
jgi:phospholipase DDHD1